MLNERALRGVLVALGTAIVVLLLAALTVWGGGDSTASLAMVGVVATLALAFAAVLTLEQSRSLVKAATDEATASREIVDEMRRERDWSYKPWLVIRRGYVEGDLPWTGASYFYVRNIGTGPAVNVKLCAHAFRGEPPTHQWLWGEAQGIAPNEEEHFLATYRGAEPSGARPDRYRCIVDDWRVSPDGEVVAVRYEDWFGRFYRSPGGPDHPLPDEWRGQQGTAEQPDWLRCQ